MGDSSGFGIWVGQATVKFYESSPDTYLDLYCTCGLPKFSHFVVNESLLFRSEYGTGKYANEEMVGENSIPDDC